MIDCWEETVNNSKYNLQVAAVETAVEDGSPTLLQDTRQWLGGLLQPRKLE